MTAAGAAVLPVYLPHLCLLEEALEESSLPTRILIGYCPKGSDNFCWFFPI